MSADIKSPDAVVYCWRQKPRAEHWVKQGPLWSSNTGPHPDWDITEYRTREHAQALQDAAVAAERERWTTEAHKMADSWDDGRPLDGTVSTALRELVRRIRQEPI